MKTKHRTYFAGHSGAESWYRCIRVPTYVYENCEIGDGLATGHFVLIRENCTIGNNVSIGTHSEIGPGVVIGNGVRIHSNCFIPELTVIEDGAWIGPCVCICNDRYPGSGSFSSLIPKCREGVTVKQSAVIGANATILPGVTIGEGALVGAGAVVTKDVKPCVIVAGNPARLI